MNETLQVPIGEQEHLKEFFKQLNENGQRQEAAEFSALVTQLSNMEQQYSAVLSELQAVRGQLDRIQDKGIKSALLKGVSAIQEKVTQAKEQLTHIKADLSQSVKKALSNVKQQGISALNKAVDFMGIKTALADMRESLQSSISRTQKSIDRINAIGSELHALNEHSRNLGRVLTGREAKELTARNEDKGVLAAVAKPLKKSKALLENMEKGVTRAIQSVDRLEQTAAKGREQKPSIREGLKAAKGQERPKRTPSPQKKQEASL
ncbi:Uncharacterised protein [Eubacterium limosum]|uniref:Uncharacterized protein n=1 Tax=Eubacterium limosum TaxID=1736 RepID=A0A6N3EVR0_EUBLI